MMQQQGSALLLVVGATAALCALALATLSVALIAYDIAALEHQGTLARLLSRSALELAAAEIGAGRLRPAPLGELVWSPPLPARPPTAPPLPEACGLRVLVTRVPTALIPLWPADPPAEVLLHAIAEGRCGRGFDRREGRFAIAADGSVRRLY